MADGISLLPEEFKKKEEEERKKRAKDRPDITIHDPGAALQAPPPTAPKPVSSSGLFGGLFQKKPQPLIAKPTAKPVMAAPTPPAKPPAMNAPPLVSQPPRPVPLGPRPAPPPKPVPPPAPVKPPPAPPLPPLKTKGGPRFSSAAGGGGVLRVSLIHGEHAASVRGGSFGLRMILIAVAASVGLVVAGAVVARAMAAPRAAEITGIDALITQTDQRIAEADASVADARRAGKQLAAVRKLLDTHVHWTNFFGYLENNTIPTVTFTRLRSESVGTVTLDALAESFSAAAEQIVVLRSSPAAIAGVDAGGMTADVAPNGDLHGVHFTVTLTLAPQLLTPGAATSTPRLPAEELVVPAP